jgi:hypothetical protein
MAAWGVRDSVTSWIPSQSVAAFGVSPPRPLFSWRDGGRAGIWQTALAIGGRGWRWHIHSQERVRVAKYCKVLGGQSQNLLAYGLELREVLCQPNREPGNLAKCSLLAKTPRRCIVAPRCVQCGATRCNAVQGGVRAMRATCNDRLAYWRAGMAEKVGPQVFRISSFEFRFSASVWVCVVCVCAPPCASVRRLSVIFCSVSTSGEKVVSPWFQRETTSAPRQSLVETVQPGSILTLG